MEYDIFREKLALKYPAYGHALWKPNPGGHCPPVEIGDVGFIREGHFHRLFNVLPPKANGPNRGSVPPHHKPLKIGNFESPPTHTDTLQCNHFCSNRVSKRLESLTNLPHEYSFLCPTGQGAILSLPVSAQREDILAKGEFGKYMLDHFEEWFTFARNRGVGIVRREDIILVTGRDLTKSWANIVFQEGDGDVTFEVRVSDSRIEWEFTLGGAGGVAHAIGPSGNLKDLPENQCIFVRGFRATRIAKIFPTLRAAAGPVQVPSDDDLDAGMQLISFPGDTQYQDPFYILLKYIAIQAPDCDMVLIHDDDLQRCIDGASLDSLQPDTLMFSLRKSALNVWQVEWDCSPTFHGASTAEALPQAAVVKVAMLSKYTSKAPAGDLGLSLETTTNFPPVFNAALKEYEKTTNRKLLAHPLAAQLRSCDSPAVILSVLGTLVKPSDQSQSGNEQLRRLLGSTVDVLFAPSTTLDEGVGLVLSPATVIFTGIGVLLLAAKDVDATQDGLFDLFSQIDKFFKCLELYTVVRPSAAMTEVIVKAMVEVLAILAIATKEVVARNRTGTFVRRILGEKDIEDALKRLESLTQEGVRMATAEVLAVMHGKRMDDNVTEVTGGGRKDAKAGNVDEEKPNQLRKKFQRWLYPPDPSTNQNHAHKAHHAGTGTWFFQSSIFAEWKSTPSLLWIYGKPGSGKSVLCSGIIEDIWPRCQAGSATMAYFYCDFRDENKQTCRNILLSILSQLCAQSDVCCDLLASIYLTHDDGTRQPSDRTLAKCLMEALGLTAQGPVYLIVDALDECPNNSGIPTARDEVLDLVQDLVYMGLPNLHICVTSRPEIDIQTALGPLTSLCVSLHDQTGQKEDIFRYISSIVWSDRNMWRWREEDKRLVIDTLSKKADGMFRWAYCQLEALRLCLPPSVRGVLDELPEALDETYTRVLREINRTNGEHANRLLHCLTVAMRPLRVEELADVLAVDFDAGRHRGIPEYNPGWRSADPLQAVLSACSSLVAVLDDGDTQVVQFSHFSVKEFLTSDRLAHSSEDVSRYHISLELAHRLLAQACLGVLLCLDHGVNKDNANDIPLAEYAAQHWVDHAQFGNVSSHIRGAMEFLFDADKPHWAAWIRAYDIDVSWEWYSPYREVEGAFPLYYASLCGFYDLVEHLFIKDPQHIEAMGGRLRTPLVAALYRKHFNVAEFLVRNGAHVDVRGIWDNTPLATACLTGSIETVRWLLHHGADINVRNTFGEVPLYLAANPFSLDRAGQLAIMGLLLEYGADVNAQDNAGSTPLHLLSCGQEGPSVQGTGTVESAHLLLEHGADIDAKDNKGRTPLQVALMHEHHVMAKFLSEHGATRPD